jgi:RNA polymerase sigma-70 factor (ECF subfamily)
MMVLEPWQLAVLVRRCQRELPHETRAFELLVKAYQGRVYTLAYRLLGNRQDAEDLAQEVFLKVFRSLQQLDDPQACTAWITRITTNACLDLLDRRRRRPTLVPFTAATQDQEEAIEYVDLKALPLEEQVMRTEMRRCLEHTLASMEPQVRVTLILRDIEERPYQEIADALALGLSAVKMRIHRARLRFQELLTRICPDLANQQAA